MKFSEIVAQAVAWLQREGRVSYRALKREFTLEDDALEDLKEELITVKELAVDKDGKMLVWTGATPVPSPGFRVPSSTQPQPLTPTPNLLHPATSSRAHPGRASRDGSARWN